MKNNKTNTNGFPGAAALFGRLLPVLLGALVCASCTTYPMDREVDVAIDHADDVKKLHEMEEKLKLTPEKAEDSPYFKVEEGVAVPAAPAYKLGPGDVLEIVYHMRYEKSPEEYTLEVQDRISVNFPYQPQFNTSVLVRSDGRIGLPLLGDLQVEGMTPRGLMALLNKKYAKYIRKPQITVALEAFNVKVDELKRAITTAPRGQSKIAPITPDGRISLPIIGGIQAAGLTVAEMEKTINQRYGDYINNLHTTLIPLEINYPKCYVLGEVSRPGAYDLNYQHNLLDAISLAGGYKVTACLSEVMVIRNEGLERPLVFKVDVDDMLSNGESFQGLTLRSADIIYVPKGKIDNANDMIAKIFTQGVYGVMPFSSSFSVNYELDPYVMVR